LLNTQFKKTRSSRQMILIEFNELCPTLLGEWIGQGHLPNFKRFRDASSAFITVADQPEPPNLEPWIQWYSIHTGLDFDQHGVFDLTDGPIAGHEDIWTFLNGHGLRVGNFSSMNAAPFAVEDGFFLADPWCSTHPACPSKLQPYQDFVSRQVKEHSRKDGVGKIEEIAQFGNFMVRNGLTIETACKFMSRLLAEKTWDRNGSWKRASLLDRLQMDVFLRLFAEFQPNFSTFFSNSTAHYQHAYWRHMDPAPFTIRPDEKEIKKYGNAILYGYQQMDRLLGRLFEIERQGLMLVLATGLSQQPFLRREGSGGQRFYRPRNIDKLLDLLGVSAIKVEPTMTHQFNLRCDPAQSTEIEQSLRSLKCDGRQVLDVRRVTDGQFYFGCGLGDVIDPGALLTWGSSNEAVPFFDLFYAIDGLKSGRHHPDGVLWFKTGTPCRHSEKVSVLDIFPTIADWLCGDDGQQWRTTPTGLPRRGRSLLPLNGEPQKHYRAERISVPNPSV